MDNFGLTSLGFWLGLGIFFAGSLGALWWQTHDEQAHIWGSGCAIIGCLCELVFGSMILWSGHSVSVAVSIGTFPFPDLVFRCDRLSAFFILVIALVGLCCSIYGSRYAAHYASRYRQSVLSGFFNLALLSLVLVVTAAQGLVFLIAWEMMAIVSYFLVAFERQSLTHVKAAGLYLIMAYCGTAFILIAFLVLYHTAGSFDFAVIKSHISQVSPFARNVVFWCAIVGFGIKAGIIPFHIWLPAAHPAAPSHFSALMSGVMIKTGIYMMIRLFFDILQPAPVWWGMVILVIGAVSAVLGVLYALTEHDLKRLLAFHSIENIGIILLGLGSALSFYALGFPPLALLGLIAALFHTLNHAIFKALLFLSAGSVISQLHSHHMADYGGLIRTMPRTAFYFLIGAMAISALPPFNGFFSEWLVFQSLFQGIISRAGSLQWLFILAAGSLAITGGLAAACFVKAFGITFLARPRSSDVQHTQESPLAMQVGMAILAMMCLGLGLGAGLVTRVLTLVGNDLIMFQHTSAFVQVRETGLVCGTFSSVSPVMLGAIMVLVFGGVYGVVRYRIYPRQQQHIGETWSCGSGLSPRMEITATGFSRSIILIFKQILRPSIQHDILFHDTDSQLLPKSRRITLGVQNVYDTYFYLPLHVAMLWVSNQVKIIQNGNINAYVSYMFVALLIALVGVLYL